MTSLFGYPNRKNSREDTYGHHQRGEKPHFTALRRAEHQREQAASISALPPSSVKNILYGKSQNPKLLTIKMLCDGLGITLGEFFSTPEFDALEQEIR